MKKEFVSYEQAVALKELKYNEHCFGYFDSKSKLTFNSNGNPINKDWVWFGNQCLPIDMTLAPLKQQVFRWFRKNHNWQHSIEATSDQYMFELGYNYWIWNNKTGEDYHTMPKNAPKGDWEYETYEEAENACIDKLIEIVKS